MRKLLYFLALAALVSSCKKENMPDDANQLAGKWEFIKNFGYIFPAPLPLPPGNGRIVVFGKNGSFERRSHDTVLFKGTYNLQVKKDCFGDQNVVFLYTTDPDFTDRDTHKNTVTFQNDTLYIDTPNCLPDGGGSVYRRL